MESKKLEENIFSNLHMISTLLASRLEMWSVDSLVAQISLNTRLSSVEELHMELGRRSRQANGSNRCMNIRQSWLFSLRNLQSLTLTHQARLFAQPSRNLRYLHYSLTSFSCSLIKVYTFRKFSSDTSTSSNRGWLHMFFISARALGLSFILSLTSIIL